jgi:hypothetical protein
MESGRGSCSTAAYFCLRMSKQLDKERWMEIKVTLSIIGIWLPVGS